MDVRFFMPSHLLRGVLVVTVMQFLSLLVWGDVDRDQASQAALAHGVAAAWQQNRSAFNRFSCHYRLTKGRAATRDDAFAEKLTNTCVAQGIWAVNDDSERCSLKANDAAVPKTVTKNRDGTGYIIAPISSRDFVSNGPIKLYSDGVGGAATLWGADWAEQANDITTPISMGVMGPGEAASPNRLIENHLNGDDLFQVSEGNGWDGGEGITILLDSGSGQTTSFTFDPKHGFLTSRIAHEIADQETIEAHVTSAKQSPDGNWFPMRSVRLDIPAKHGSPISVQLIEVTELNFSPDSHDFGFTLPAGTTLVDRSNAHSQHRLQKPLEVSPAALPEIEKHLRQIAANREAGLPLTAELAQPRKTNWWLVIGATLLTAIIAWLLLWKFRRSDSRV